MAEGIVWICLLIIQARYHLNHHQPLLRNGLWAYGVFWGFLWSGIHLDSVGGNDTFSRTPLFVFITAHSRNSRWWFQIFSMFTTWENFDYIISFQMGWNQQLVLVVILSMKKHIQPLVDRRSCVISLVSGIRSLVVTCAKHRSCQNVIKAFGRWFFWLVEG